MKFKLICVGTHMPNWVKLGYEDYAKRMTGAYALELIEIQTSKRHKLADIQRLVAEEAERIGKYIKAQDYVIALDETGKQFTSKGFAEHIADINQAGQNIIFIIGGPDGLAKKIITRANLILSLAKSTYPHQLVRVMIAEQLYRAFSILQGHPYHRE